MQVTRNAASVLDLSGMHCPWTVLRCKAAVGRLHAGAELVVTTNNVDATRAIHLFIRRGDTQFLDVQCDERGCHFKVRVSRPIGTPRPLGRMLAGLGDASRSTVGGWLEAHRSEALRTAVRA